ncbi:exported hypothetical protein [Candidatus Sulfopaludibacter sp. SbA3]|nr:exported hypothetical protein [Candidatus Sulfopaludibacter sp. SbA3]
MSRPRTATIVTMLLLAALLATAVLRKTVVRQTALAATPQDTIYGMLDAARAGDGNAYLGQYAGPMEAQLRQAIAEKTAADFKGYLQASNAEIKGVAVSEPKTLSDREVEVRVEFIYQDRNEVQRMVLEKFSGNWKITRVDGAERVKTLVPYGSPVE